MSPRWLTDTEMQAWRGLLTTDRLLFEQLGRDLQQDSGLSMADYEVLVQLSEAPGRRLRMTELAAMSLLSKSRLSHQVARMEDAGWVRREACHDDRRGAFAVLTDGGFDVLVAAAPGHVESVRAHLFDHLSAEEVRQLAAITGRLSEELSRSMQPVRKVS
jgi:DNA-binding MarR family transcriptional regulator